MSQAGEQTITSTIAAHAADPVAPGNVSVIEQQQVEMIYARAPSSLVAAFCIALLLTVCLWDVADQTYLGSWFVAQLVLTVVRLWHVRLFRKTDPAERNTSQWERSFLVGALVSGVAWGCIGLVYDFSWEIHYQILVIMCMTGLQTAAVSSYAAINSIYVAFLAPSVIIFAQSLMVSQGKGQSLIGIMFLICAAVLLAFSRNLSRSIYKSLQLREKHEALLGAMSRTNASLESEISTRQEVEHELLRERQLFTEGPVIVYRCRNEEGWPVEYISETVTGFGYAAEKIMRCQMAFSNLVYPDDLQRLQESKIIPGNNSLASLGIDYRVVCGDGEVRWVYDYVVPVACTDGEISHYSGYLIDITDRKQAEFELQKERDRVQVTLHSIADAVITTDVNGRVEYLNPMAERMTGWVNTIAHGLSIYKVFCLFDEKDIESRENPVSQCLNTADVVKSGKDSLLRRHDGEMYSIQYSISPIKNEEGVPLGVIIVFTDVTETRNLEKKITFQATHDSLTGLINRHEFETQLDQILNIPSTENDTHALCCLNIDQFKLVNDTCCHDVGDKLLVEITGILRACLRESDILARIGGDEFGILLRNCSQGDAIGLAETMLNAVREMSFTSSKSGLDTTISIGMVPVNGSSKSVTSLMSSADLACYAAKDFGGNRLHVYESEDQDLARRHTEMQWVSRLTTAIESNMLVLYCQKIMPVSEDIDAACHFEVLIRMLDDEGNIIPPNSFLPAAERYNMITNLDRWVVSHSFSWYAQNKTAIEAGKLDTMSINLSGASVTDNGFMQHIRNELLRYKVDPHKICFEITETAAIANLDAAVEFIGGLKKIGCRFSLDDFGSGLSSFAYLKNLPVDYLKIDGSFVRNMETDSVDCAMVSAIHELGRLVGIQTIAEFVENDEILKKLAEIGVDFAQGYGISKPVPLDSIEIHAHKTA